jgi:nucleoside-diphosphate-sugar epimerase
MILVTGGTGFVGKALVRQLSEMGKPVRILLRPSPESPNLPKSVPVEVAVCSLRDERGIRAALKGVDAVYHLAGAERKGSRSDLTGVDVEGTRILAQACAQAGVERLIYLSHIGADRFSAYPVLKAKAIAEHHIINSGVDYTILRSAIVFGPNDQFTTMLSKLIKISPAIFLIPGDGETLLQPLFINDLVTCLAWVLKDHEMANKMISLGGGEFLSFKKIIEIIMIKMSKRRTIIPVFPAYLRMLSIIVEQFTPGFPVSIFWLDYLAADRTCTLDTLPRSFGLIPARFEHHLDYLNLE